MSGLHACPRCYGTLHAEWEEPRCINCGWAGPTVDGASVQALPEGNHYDGPRPLRWTARLMLHPPGGRDASRTYPARVDLLYIVETPRHGREYARCMALTDWPHRWRAANGPGARYIRTLFRQTAGRKLLGLPDALHEYLLTLEESA